MKILCSILAIFFLALSCIPCSDAKYVVAQNVNPGVSQTDAGHSEDAPKEHQDLCSPFCHCSCCTVFCTITNLQVTDFTSKTVYIDKAFAHYLPLSPVGIVFPVWQPPKTSADC